jgi:hypothetical protein
MQSGPSPSSPRRAIRLTFAYEGDDVRLVDRVPVEAIVAPGEPEPVPEGAAGFWVELRDRSGRALYRQTLDQPIRLEAEVFPEDHGELPHHVSRTSPRGAFVIVVPDLPEAERAALWSSPPRPERAHEAASSLIEIPLRSRRRGGTDGRP